MHCRHKNTVHALFISAVLLFIVGCSSVPTKYQTTKLADQLTQVTRLNQPINDLSSLIQLAIAHQNFSSLTDRQTSFLQQSAELDFDTHVNLTAVQSAIMQSMSAQELHQVLTWYRSNVGKRILIAEADLRQDYRKKIINHVDPKREKLIKQLLRHKYASDEVIHRLHLATLAVGEAVNILKPDVEHQKDKCFCETLAVVVPMFEKDMLNNALHAFLPLSLQDLQQYNDFLVTEAAGKMLTALEHGLEQAIKESLILWQESLKRRVTKANSVTGHSIISPNEDLAIEYPFSLLANSITITRDEDLRELESNGPRLAQYFQTYTGVHLVTRDGQWTGNIILPEDPIFEGRLFRLTVESTWAVNIYYAGRIRVVSTGSHFYAKYINGRWVHQ